MALARERCYESLKRVIALTRMSEDEAQQYVDTILEFCGWMRADRFEDVAKELAGKMQHGRKPTPDQFKQAYNRLASDRGWTREEVAACASCSGVRFVGIRVQTPGGEEYDCLRPCPSCNRDLAQKYQKMPEGFQQVPSLGSGGQCMEDAKALSAPAAAWVMKKAEDIGIKYGETLQSVLTDRFMNGPTPNTAGGMGVLFKRALGAVQTQHEEEEHVL